MQSCINKINCSMALLLFMHDCSSVDVLYNYWSPSYSHKYEAIRFL